MEQPKKERGGRSFSFSSSLPLGNERVPRARVSAILMQSTSYCSAKEWTGATIAEEFGETFPSRHKLRCAGLHAALSVHPDCLSYRMHSHSEHNRRSRTHSPSKSLSTTAPAFPHYMSLTSAIGVASLYTRVTTWAVQSSLHTMCPSLPYRSCSHPLQPPIRIIELWRCARSRRHTEGTSQQYIGSIF